MMDPAIRKLLTPGPAEIIRATHKDHDFVNKLIQNIQEVVQSIVGQRRSIKWQNHIVAAAALLYHSFTNLSGGQTLGEEYCGILQINRSASQTPGKIKTALMILFTTFGQTATQKVIQLLEGHLKALSENTRNIENRNQLVTKGIGVLGFFRHYLPLLTQLHLAIFYVYGTYYHFAKRLLGIQYLLVRRSMASDDPHCRRTLKYLMWISIVNSFLRCISDSFVFVKTASAEHEETINSDKHSSREPELDAAKRCILCLDRRKNCTVTPCGHLFCWDCIVDWLRSKQECPVCREECLPSRVVPLQNYD